MKQWAHVSREFSFEPVETAVDTETLQKLSAALTTVPDGFSEGCREVEEGEHRRVTGGRWGFIDRSGSLVIPLDYEAAGSFEGGAARVKRRGRWIRIGPDGAIVVNDGR